MEYTEELTLVKLTPSQDAIGQVTNTEVTTSVLARPNIVGSKEFYNAMAVGIRPTAELMIRASNYDGQQEVVYQGKRYQVIRTIPKNKLDIVLVIGIKQGVNG